MSWPIAPVPCQPCRSMSCSKKWWVPGSTARAEWCQIPGKGPVSGDPCTQRRNHQVVGPACYTGAIFMSKKLLLVRNHKIKLMKILAFIIFSISPPLRGFPTSGGARFICENEGRGSHCGKSVSTFAHKKKTGVFLVDVFSTPLKWTIKQ